MLSQEDLKTLRSKNYQLIFNVGLPFTGKKTQCEKIANEFKYSKLIMQDIINKEIKSNTNLGKEAQKCIENKEPIKTEILASILVSNIIESKELSIMIEGFPNKLEEALFFEQKIMPIKKIIKYNITEDESFYRTNESSETKKLKNQKLVFWKSKQNQESCNKTIVKGILENHNFDYGVNSTLNVGTTFYFRIKKSSNKK